MKRTLSAILVSFLLVPAAATAQSIGESEFMNSCASCHGVSGIGDGPLAGFLSGSLPNLTQLAENNGGVFPVTMVYSTIDGTMTAGPHGTGEMPVWGNRYRVRGEQVANPDFSTDEAMVFARFRILALTEYLAGIQQ